MLCSCDNSATSKKSDSEASASEEVSKDNLSDEEIVKAELEKMLSDVANQKNEKFQLFTKDFLVETMGEEWYANEDENVNMIKGLAEHPEAWVDFLKRCNAECTEKGFDWSNYSIESVKIDDKQDQDFNKDKVTVYRGTFKVKSGDKVYDFEFKNLTFIKDAARYVDGFGISPDE